MKRLFIGAFGPNDLIKLWEIARSVDGFAKLIVRNETIDDGVLIYVGYIFLNPDRLLDAEVWKV